MANSLNLYSRQEKLCKEDVSTISQFKMVNDQIFKISLFLILFNIKSVGDLEEFDAC